jgi:hypothetical protein
VTVIFVLFHTWQSDWWGAPGVEHMQCFQSDCLVFQIAIVFETDMVFIITTEYFRTLL